MMTLVFRMFVLGWLGALLGCSSQNDPSSYFKTFDHIVTDQYRETYGQGGIYWVSNDHVVLEAYLKTEQSDLDLGIYQVSVNDGSFIKVVDITDDQPTTYKFCFDGAVLHVMTKRGDFNLVTAPQGYKVLLRQMREKNRSNEYSPIRCQFVEIPKEKKTGYAVLKAEDGLMKNKAGETEHEPVKVFLSDDFGQNLVEISERPVGLGGVRGVRRYIPYANAYFGNSYIKNNCTDLSWIFRDGWRLEQKRICLGDKPFGSRVIHSVKGALYVEHITERKNVPKSYVIIDGKELTIETDMIRGSSVSPDGCKVAYGIGGYSGKSGLRQQLKLFNYCEYLEKGLN